MDETGKFPKLINFNYAEHGIANDAADEWGLSYTAAVLRIIREWDVLQGMTIYNPRPERNVVIND